jgi:hypothetical protein
MYRRCSHKYCIFKIFVLYKDHIIEIDFIGVDLTYFLHLKPLDKLIHRRRHFYRARHIY